MKPELRNIYEHQSGAYYFNLPKEYHEIFGEDSKYVAYPDTENHCVRIVPASRADIELGEL